MPRQKKITEEKPARKERRSNVEMLKMPRAALQRIREVSLRSRMSVDQVYADTLDLGLSEVERMYSGMIAMREELQKRSRHEPEQPRTNGDNGGTIRDARSAGLDVRHRPDGDKSLPAGERVIESSEQSPDVEGSGDPPLGFGRGSEDEEGTGLVIAEDGDPGIQPHE